MATMFEKYGPTNASQQLKKLAEIDKKLERTRADVRLLKQGASLIGEEGDWGKYFYAQHIFFKTKRAKNAKPFYEAVRANGSLAVQTLSQLGLAMVADLAGAANTAEIFDEAVRLADELGDTQARNLVLAKQLDWMSSRDDFTRIDSVSMPDMSDFRSWDLAHSVLNIWCTAFRQKIGELGRLEDGLKALTTGYEGLVGMTDFQAFQAKYFLTMRVLEVQALSGHGNFAAYTGFLAPLEKDYEVEYASGLFEALLLVFEGYVNISVEDAQRWVAVVVNVAGKLGADFYVEKISSEFNKWKEGK